MTDAIETDTELVAPPGHYYATMKGRNVLVKDINAAQSMVMGGMIRQSKNADFETNFDILGKVMKLFENLVVNAEDRDWLEEGILNGEVQVEDFALIWIGKTRPDTQPASKKPKRGK